ncbi:MAG: hypothetical protein IKP73_08235 [Bacteroidales bacterium]|nr:hypothetical protein [Bacteroidales bacterium]
MEVMRKGEILQNMWKQGKFSISAAKIVKASVDDIYTFLEERIQDELRNKSNWSRQNQPSRDDVFGILSKKIVDLDRTTFDNALKMLTPRLVSELNGVLRLNCVVLPNAAR